MLFVEGSRETVVANDDAEFQHLAVSAVGEAFNNVVVHAYADRPGQVAIEIEPTSRALVVRLMDEGTSFDPSVVPAPQLELLPEGGMGLYIMRAAMDEVVYEAGSPNVLRLVKLRAAADSVTPPQGADGDETGDRPALLALLACEAEETSRISGTRPAAAAANGTPRRNEPPSSGKSGFRPKTVPPPDATARDPRRA